MNPYPRSGPISPVLLASSPSTHGSRAAGGTRAGTASVARSPRTRQGMFLERVERLVGQNGYAPLECVAVTGIHPSAKAWMSAMFVRGLQFNADPAAGRRTPPRFRWVRSSVTRPTVSQQPIHPSATASGPEELLSVVGPAVEPARQSEADRTNNSPSPSVGIQRPVAASGVNSKYRGVHTSGC